MEIAKSSEFRADQVQPEATNPIAMALGTLV
jgi:hypothetical protein